MAPFCQSELWHFGTLAKFCILASAPPRTICRAVVTLHRHQIPMLNTILPLIAHNIYIEFLLCKFFSSEMSFIFDLWLLSWLQFARSKLSEIASEVDWVSETASLHWPWQVWGQKLLDNSKMAESTFLNTRTFRHFEMAKILFLKTSTFRNFEMAEITFCRQNCLRFRMTKLHIVSIRDVRYFKNPKFSKNFST